MQKLCLSSTDLGIRGSASDLKLLGSRLQPSDLCRSISSDEGVYLEGMRHSMQKLYRPRIPWVSSISGFG
jgi:hypothetical protein